jgi:uncharacterized membrane protein
VLVAEGKFAWSTGELQTKEDQWANAVGTVAVDGASIVASIATGAAIGTLIPVPVVGTVIGAVAGAAVGLGITHFFSEGARSLTRDIFHFFSS